MIQSASKTKTMWFSLWVRLKWRDSGYELGQKDVIQSGWQTKTMWFSMEVRPEQRDSVCMLYKNNFIVHPVS